MLPAVRGTWCASWLLLACACAPAGGVPSLPPPIPEVAAANEAMGDPYAGRFPLEEALAGLPGSSALIARLATDEGEILCTLDERHAPLTVANFVGLARGLRPWKDEAGTWQRTPYYDGVPWHRAMPGMFVQTGRRGNLEAVGFFLQDELGPGDDFSRPGVLAMANQGQPHSGAVQFFITTGPVEDLRGLHTIFGRCDDVTAARRLERRAGTTPLPILQHVTIERAGERAGG
jgi:peptidyl-prolyl cis-trans isomerase A (cyclophilin A)